MTEQENTTYERISRREDTSCTAEGSEEPRSDSCHPWWQSWSLWHSCDSRNIQSTWNPWNWRNSASVGASRKQWTWTVLTLTMLAFFAVCCTLWLWQSNLEKWVEIDEWNGNYPGKIWQWNERHYKRRFDEFCAEFNRRYDEKEKDTRYQIFKSNVTIITAHNEENHSYKLAVNKFTDWSREEFKNTYLGRTEAPKHLKRISEDHLQPVDESTIPDAIDWRVKGCVSRVRDQGQCGSCWAFSAVGALEGQYCLETGTLKAFSEQQLVDCANPEGNFGCRGGNYEKAWKYYLDENAYVCTESEYDYMASEGICKDTNCKLQVDIVNWKNIPKGSVIALKRAIATHGPLSVSIDASSRDFAMYSHGVFSASCGLVLDHAVLVVGYGHDDELNKDYWIVKNSWSSAWGENGYIRMDMHHGPEGECGILLDPAYPIFKYKH